MKKIISLIMIAVLAFGLVACTGNNISEAFDEKEVTDRVGEIVDILNSNDKEALLEASGPAVKEALNDQVLDQVFSDINEFGKFDNISKISMAEKSDDDGNKYVSVVAQAIYENKKCIYTISFDEEMNLVGLFYK